MRGLVLVLVVAMSACAGPAGRSISAAEFAEMERERLALEEAALDRPRRSSARSEEAAHLAEEQAELEAALARMAERREQIVLEHELRHDEVAAEVELARRALARAREEVTHHQEVVVPRRLREDALERAEVEEQERRLTADLEELQALYAASDDPVAQRVLAEARRELERARERVEVRKAISLELTTWILPREVAALEDAVTRRSLTLGLTERRLHLAGRRMASESDELTAEEQQLHRRLEALVARRSELLDEEDAARRTYPDGGPGAIPLPRRGGDGS